MHRFGKQSKRAWGPVAWITPVSWVHARSARKYWPLGNTLGNGADSSGLQVPMLTNFTSMQLQLDWALQKVWDCICSRIAEEPYKRRLPPRMHTLNPVHPLLPLLIISSCIFFFSCTAIL